MRNNGVRVAWVLVATLSLLGFASSQTCSVLFDFEAGTQGWTVDASTGAEAVTQSNLHATSLQSSAKLVFKSSNKAIFQFQYDSPRDFSQSKIQFDLWKQGSNPSSVAIALVTGAGQEWIESSPMSLSDGSTSVSFDTKTTNWKSERSGWSYNIAVTNANQVNRIAILLLSNTQTDGEAYVDNVRLCGAAQATTTVTAPSSPSVSSSKSPVSPPASLSAFVSAKGREFSWGGCPYYYTGTNNYYMTYQSPFMTTDVLDASKSMGFNVVRIWGFIDRGSLDGSVPDIDGAKNGVYFQYWDSSANKPTYNEGSDGLPKLDFVLAEAAKRGIKLIVTLTNNWKEFGGMDQYGKWFGLSYHSDFYTNSRAKDAYKAWASYLINRKNTITGITYRDDPTIFSWELANEPRCKGSGNLGQDSACNTATITNWAKEMSAYIKSIDKNHMVSVGDEGFFNTGGSDWIYNGGEGVDFDALLALPNIDFGTFHLYPSHWSKSADWGVTYINEHIKSSQTIGKPVIAEEYGYPNSDRPNIYSQWTKAIEGGLAGDNFWMIAGKENSNGQLYPDYDGFTIYNDNSDAANVLKTHAKNMAAKNQGCTRTGVNDVDGDGESSKSSKTYWIVSFVLVGAVVAVIAGAIAYKRIKARRTVTVVDSDNLLYHKMQAV